MDFPSFLIVAVVLAVTFAFCYALFERMLVRRSIEALKKEEIPCLNLFNVSFDQPGLFDFKNTEVYQDRYEEILELLARGLSRVIDKSTVYDLKDGEMFIFEDRKFVATKLSQDSRLVKRRSTITALFTEVNDDFNRTENGLKFILDNSHTIKTLFLSDKDIKDLEGQIKLIYRQGHRPQA